MFLALRRTDTRRQDIPDRFETIGALNIVRHRVRFKPPHRPSGPNDLEQISVVDCGRHGILAGYRLSRGCAMGSLSARSVSAAARGFALPKMLAGGC